MTLVFCPAKGMLHPHWEKFISYEIIYGWSPPMVTRVHKELLTDYLISESLKRLQLTLGNSFPQIQATQRIRHCLPDYLFQPGDTVLDHHFKNDYMEPRYIMIVWVPTASRLTRLVTFISQESTGGSYGRRGGLSKMESD